MKRAFITVGYDFDCMEAYFEKNMYDNVEMLFCPAEREIDSLNEEFKILANTGCDIGLCDKNPTVANREFYINLCHNFGYKTSCILFDIPIEVAFYYAHQIEDVQERRCAEGAVYAFFNHFKRPSPSEGFDEIVIAKKSQAKTCFGKNKAVFFPIQSLIEVKNGKDNLGEITNCSIFGNPLSCVDEMKNLGYKIIVCADMNFLNRKDMRDCIFTARNICKIIGFVPDHICSSRTNGAKCGRYKIPSPDGINSASEKLKVDISNSIMVGSEDFEIGLSQLCGFKHYFHRECFFLANSFVLDAIDGDRK